MEKADLEILLKFYDTSRQEILIRITARDNTLLIYLGAIAAIIGASFQTDHTLFLLVIPYLALGISLIISNHHAGIAALATYCSTELGELLKQNNITIPQWENSKIRFKYSNRTFITRYLGDIILINVPSLLSLVVTSSDYKNHKDLLLIFIFAWICFFLSIFLLVFTLRFRNQMNKRRHEFISETGEFSKAEEEIQPT
jgi:hypothetical protein